MTLLLVLIIENLVQKQLMYIILVTLQTVRFYALLHDQSKRSLVTPELFTLLGINGQKHEYTLRSCAGVHFANGHREDDCFVRSLDITVFYALPSLVESSNVPNNRNAICTSAIASCHPQA